MTIQMNTCAQGQPTAAFRVPIPACVHVPEGTFTKKPAYGSRIWETEEWYDGIYPRDFNHNLNLEAPCLCTALAVFRVKTATGGWQVGDIISANGANYIGATKDSEMGWYILLSPNNVKIYFPINKNLIAIKKSGGFQLLPKENFQLKIVIRY